MAEWDRVWGDKPKNAGSQLSGYCEVRGLRGERGNPDKAGAFQEASLPVCTQSTDGATGTPTQCYSPRYAGAMGTATTGRFTTANMGWYQTAYKSQPSMSCPSPAYFTWAGFGGFGEQLMQAGTVSSPEIPGTSLSTSAMFWEIIGRDVVSPPSYVFTAGDQMATVPGGHDTRVYLAYDHPGHDGEAIFTVRDVDNNVTRSTGWFSRVTYGGRTYPISHFYDGQQVGFYTEGGGKDRSVREPYLGNTLIYATKANGRVFTDFRTVNVTNTFNANLLQESTFSNTGGSWRNDFKRCR